MIGAPLIGRGFFDKSGSYYSKPLELDSKISSDPPNNPPTDEGAVLTNTSLLHAGCRKHEIWPYHPDLNPSLAALLWLLPSSIACH